MLTLKTTKQVVKQIAFSADGLRIAAIGSSRKVSVFNLNATKLKPFVLPTFNHPLTFIGFMPDEQLFAMSGMGEYAFHDCATRETIRSALKQWWIGCVVPTSDYSAIYATGWQSWKWTIVNHQLREQWKHDVSEHSYHGGGGIVLTHEDQLVSAVDNGSSRTWLQIRNVTTGQLQKQQLVANSLIRDLSLLPDGKTVAFVREKQYNGPTGNAFVVGNLGAKYQIARGGTHDEMITAFAVHPSGASLALAFMDGTVRTLDTTHWSEINAYQWPLKSISAVAFAPDGLKAAAGDSIGQIVVWDID